MTRLKAVLGWVLISLLAAIFWTWAALHLKLLVSPRLVLESMEESSLFFWMFFSLMLLALTLLYGLCRFGQLVFDKPGLRAGLERAGLQMIPFGVSGLAVFFIDRAYLLPVPGPGVHIGIDLAGLLALAILPPLSCILFKTEYSLAWAIALGCYFSVIRYTDSTQGQWVNPDWVELQLYFIPVSVSPIFITLISWAITSISRRPPPSA